MAFWGWVRRGSARRGLLGEESRKVAERLANSPLSIAAPEVASAIGALHKVVTTSAFDAVDAAHTSLALVCEGLVQNLRKDFERSHTEEADKLRELASRCRDEVERTHEQQTEQAEHLRTLRDIYAAQQEQARRWTEGYDWQITKAFCFRIIGILDGLDERLTELRAGRTASESHVRDVEKFYRDSLHTLEASGVLQIQPQLNTTFAGTEQQAEVVAQVSTDIPRDDGLIAKVRKPGYVLVYEGEPDRVLRRAQVEVFASAEYRQAPELQEL